MTYTFISQNQRDSGVIIGHMRSWDDVVREAWLPWMVGRPVKEILAWCKRYRIGWKVEL